jgi:hypothetical protein
LPMRAKIPYYTRPSFLGYVYGGSMHPAVLIKGG